MVDNKLSKSIDYLISLGSNIEPRLFYIRGAISELQNLLKEIIISSLYESDPLLKSDMPKSWHKSYYNCVILGKSHLPPNRLLGEIKKIEQKFGRQAKRLKWSPRTIDIDILMAQELIIKKNGINIPHIEFLHRSFCLVPANEICSQAIHPIVKKTINEIVCQNYSDNKNLGLRKIGKI